jgi:ABC-type branched-subunit amino acid transport system ATPase component
VRITPASNEHGEELTDPMRQVAAVLEASGYHPGRTALDRLRILAAAMLSGSSVLVLDEPTYGLDTPGVRRLRGYVRQLAVLSYLNSGVSP